MISLAIMHALQDNGFGTYGENLWWNSSPVMDTGVVSANEGIWVNSLPSSVSGDMYTDTVTVSTRYTDPRVQTLTMLRLTRWLEDTAPKICQLSCAPTLPITFTNVDIRRLTAASLDAVDNEGRWVESLQFIVAYKLPRDIPETVE